MAEKAATFVAALREKSASPVYFAELEGVQHAFEIFHSPRTEHAVRGVAAFLERIWADYEKRAKEAA
jgi:acetyl esterase/lipase